MENSDESPNRPSLSVKQLTSNYQCIATETRNYTRRQVKTVEKEMTSIAVRQVTGIRQVDSSIRHRGICTTTCIMLRQGHDTPVWTVLMKTMRYTGVTELNPGLIKIKITSSL